jgi:ABC-2 type transport system permease protein
MSTTTVTSPPATSSPQNPAAGEGGLSFARIVVSEWIKFRTLRSTVWTLVITLALILAIVTVFCAFIASSVPSGTSGNVDGVGSSTFVFGIAAGLAQLPVVVLGVLVISGEYSTGMIRSTFAAVPTRLPALWAKAVVLAGSILVVSTLGTGLSLGIMQLWLGSSGLAPELADAETVRVVMGLPLYLTAIVLFAFAIGALLRHSAGALATVLGVLLVIDTVFSFPWKPIALVGRFLPGNAGTQIMMVKAQLDQPSQNLVGVAPLGPWQGYGVLLVWVAVLMTAAALLVRHRDA